MRSSTRLAGGTALLAATALLATACGSGGPSGSSTGSSGKTVTLVTHDSFAVPKETLAAFEKRSGLKVRVLRSGDAGAAVNQAVLTKDNPQGDVFFGVDNTLLGKALKAGLFTSYRPAGSGKVPAELRPEGAGQRVTPVDFGDVCVNYDRAWFRDHHLKPPATLADLTEPRYSKLLVTENAATSSPGLAFLLATVAKYGEHGWQGYWKKLAANGADVVDSWEQVYNSEFTGAKAAKGKGTRPLAVSYDTSPPVEVSDPAKTPADKAPTGIIPDTCFRQTEYAGLLHGAKNPAGGRKLLDFLLSEEFQRGVPGAMYMWPARGDVKAPSSWTKYVDVPSRVRSVSPAVVERNRERWVKTWTGLVVK